MQMFKQRISMDTHKRATLLIVDESQTRSIDVDTRWLPYIKPALIGLAAATAILSVSVCALLYKNHTAAKDTAALRERVGDLQNFTSAEVNAKITELRKSEKAVLELQNYLQARGAYTAPSGKSSQENQPNNAAGGPLLKVSASTPFMGSFSQTTAHLLDVVKHIPLGVPIQSEMTSRFGVRANPFTGEGGEFHPGLDFRGQVGDPVKATANGTVNFAGYQNGYGNMVKIALSNGYEIMFGHLSEIDVQMGQTINAGDLVGKVGSTGRSTGPHLHYEIRKDGTPIDPEHFLTLSSPAQ